MIAHAERKPPYDLAAEQGVLSGMFQTPEIVDLAVEALGSDGSAFHRETHRRLFRAMACLRDTGGEIDHVTLCAELKRAGDFESVGGVPAVAALLDECPAPAMAERYCAIVHAHATRRRLIDRLSQATALAYDVSMDARDVLREAERMVLDADLTSSTARDEMKDLDALLMDYLTGVENSEWGIRTGWNDLDYRTRGWRPSKLYIIAARPSMGKSSFLEQAALHAAIEEGRFVDFYATEADRDEFMDRGIQMRAMLDMETFRRQVQNAPDQADYGRFSHGAAELKRAGKHLRLSTSILTVAGIEANSRRNQRREGLDLIFIDHWIDMKGPGGTGEEIISRIARDCKQLARRLNVPVVAATQLSRTVEREERRKEGYRPRLSDLRQAGEEPADMVGLLYRPEYYFPQGMKDKDGNTIDVEGKAELIIAKHRNGWRGTIPFYFHKEYTKFEGLDRMHRG